MAGGSSDEGRRLRERESQTLVDFLIDGDRCLRAEIRADDQRANFAPFVREHRELPPAWKFNSYDEYKLEMYVNAVHGGAIIKRNGSCMMINFQKKES